MVKDKLKKIILTGIIAVTAFSVIGCGKEPAKNKEVNIGYFNNITHAQALMMKAEGTLDKSLGDDVSVKWTAFNAGPAEVEALFSGDIDIGYIGPVPAISANVKSKGDVVIISSATKGGAVLVKKKGADINSVADLDGKVVAIPQIGNTQHLCLLKLLADNGLKPDTSGGTVKVSAVANADVANTMERGDIDAALVPEPWGATLLANDAEMVLDYNEIFENGEYDVAVVVVRKEFMEENPEIVDEFLKQHEAATKKVNDDKENSLKTINNELKEATGKSLGDDIISEAFERIGVSTEVNEQSVTGFADISKSEGFISELPEGELICR